MKAAGIIAEYNPFHRGHQYHIRQTRRITKAECILAVMSGNFLQRGEAALYDKWTRAEMAVLGGADLVLELPAAFACNSAEFFAKGAVSLLEGLGGIQYLSFGCEVEDVVLLRQAAALLAEEPEAWKESLRKSLKEGESFAKARWKATQAFLSQKNGQEPFFLSGGPEVQERLFYALQQPNTILAVEYMKQLIRQKSSIEPVLIRREGSGFHEEAIAPGTFASAKAVRNALKQGTPVSALTVVLPQTTIQTALRYLKTSYPIENEDFFQMIRYQLIRSDPGNLEEILSASEGIENRAARAALQAESFEELAEAIKSKRYSATSVHRFLFHTLLGLTSLDMQSFSEPESLYARVLAANDRGRSFLRERKKDEKTHIPVISNSVRALKDNRISPRAKKLLAFDMKAAAIYQMKAAKSRCYDRTDFIRSPFVNLQEKSNFT